MVRLALDRQTHPGGATGYGATDLVMLLELLTGRQPVEVLPAQRGDADEVTGEARRGAGRLDHRLRAKEQSEEQRGGDSCR